MSNLLQMAADPQQLARLKAMAALFGQTQQPAKVADETPTAPPPAPTLTGSTAASQPAPGTPGPSQPPTTAQPLPNVTPGSFPKKGYGTGDDILMPGQKPAVSLATPGAISGAMQPQQPDALSRFREWEQAEPQAPNPQNYKGGIARRLLGAGAGAAVGAATRNPQEGQAVAREVAYPGLSAAQNLYGQAEQRWKTQGAGLTEEEKLRNFESEISDRESQAQERKAKAEGEQVVPFKLPSGEEIQVRRQDIPRMETAFKPGAAARLQLKEIVDPNAPGGHRTVEFDPVKGEFLDYNTKQPIPNAQAYTKSSSEKIAEDIKQQIADAYQKGDKKTVARLQGELKAIDPLGAERVNISLQGLGDREKTAADKKNEPYQNTLDTYSEAQEYVRNPNPMNDIALTLAFVEATRPKAGFRMTQTEWNQIRGARGILGDIEALQQRVENGQSLTPQQRQQMLNAIRMKADIAQRHLSGGGEPGGGGGAGAAPKVGDVIFQNGHPFKVTAVGKDGKVTGAEAQ